MSLQTQLRPLRKPLMWLSSALALFLVSCSTGSEQTADLVRIHAGPNEAAAATSIPLPSDSYDDRRRNGAINGAVRFGAESGCPSAGLALYGPPTRVLATLTPVGNAAGLVNPEANLHTPPEGAPPLMVWVIVVEGQSVELSTGAEAGSRAFVLVIDPIDVRYTGCVVRDAPMPIKYQEPASDGYEFEVLLDARPQ